MTATVQTSYKWQHLVGTQNHELNVNSHVTHDFRHSPHHQEKAELPLDKLSGLSPRRPLEKGAVWSYQKHHHSINTQSSLGKPEQLDIQRGQSGQVQALVGLLWLGHQTAKPKFSHRPSTFGFIPA